MIRTHGSCSGSGFLPGPLGAAEVKEEKVDGYLEWRLGDVMVADGQRIHISPATKFKGKGEAKAVASIPWATSSRPRDCATTRASWWPASWRPSPTARRCSRAR